MNRFRNVFAGLLRLYRRTEQRELGLIAAGVAFFGFLAIFPAIAAVIALWGFAYDPAVIRTQLEVLSQVLPEDAYVLVEQQVNVLLGATSRQLGWATALSTAFALWSARAGVAALIRGLNAIHGYPNRSGAGHQLRALVVTVVLVGLALAAMLSTVLLPVLFAFLPLGNRELSLLHLANMAVGLALPVLGVGLAYRLGPNHTTAGRRGFLSVGLVVAVTLWMAAAWAFAAYLASFGSFNRVYGSIGAVAAFLMWLYLSSYAVLLGAAVDAERRRPSNPSR